MKFTIQAGTTIDTVTPGELDERLIAFNRELHQQFAGTKFAGLPPVVLSAAAVAGVLKIGGDTGAQQVGPAAGFAWIFRRLAVTGLTRGTTPDVVWLYRYGRNSFTPVWEFNGNSWAYTFGRGEMVYQAGQYVAVQSVGTFAATGPVTLTGEYTQVPEQRLGEFAV